MEGQRFEGIAEMGLQELRFLQLFQPPEYFQEFPSPALLINMLFKAVRKRGSSTLDRVSVDPISK